LQMRYGLRHPLAAEPIRRPEQDTVEFPFGCIIE
jgi:hypothetical protein